MDEYGPQTKEIKRFLERIRELTPEKAEELKAAWYPAEDTVWNTAWNTAEDASRHAFRDTVWDAVWDAVQYPAWNAVRCAVLALVVKDLISEEHFNILYGPWKSVIGG